MTDRSEYDFTPPKDVINDFDVSTLNRISMRGILDHIYRENGYGSMSASNFLTLSGHNLLRQGQPSLRANRDNMGYTFFTRPCLNLTYDNLGQVRRMSALSNPPPKSISAWVISTLDPWQSLGIGKGNSKTSGENLITPLVNPHDPFIPILGTTLLSLSGWKDMSGNDFTSQAGINNEQWGYYDGYFNVTGSFELSASFRNIEGDPIGLLFQVWGEYMANVATYGYMMPYPSFLETNTMDYNTGIYRFIMDHDKTFIQKWTRTLAWPTSLPYGNQFNFTSNKNFVEVNDEIPITFKCFGAEYNDPAVLHDFNTLVAQYNPGLKITGYDEKTRSCIVAGQSEWVKVSKHERVKANMLALPLINVYTNELEWWITKENYETYVRPGFAGAVEIAKRTRG